MFFCQANDNSQDFCHFNYWLKKWAESGGARVVPIMDFGSDQQLYAMLSKINGVIFPGGGADTNMTSPFMIFQKKIYDWVLNQNMKGNYFPLWGTCQGFESIANAASGYYILSSFDAENLTLPLKFTADFKTSQMFGPKSGVTDAIIEKLSQKPINIHFHELGVSPDDFMKSDKLKNNFRILAMNGDRKGKVFVSAYEHKEYPIFALQVWFSFFLKRLSNFFFEKFSFIYKKKQFHPEKNMFEWHETAVIHHCLDSIQASSFFAQFLIEQARKNKNKFPTRDEEWNSLIYNYPITYTFFKNQFTLQSYLFPRSQRAMSRNILVRRKEQFGNRMH